jgi:hypothetical protein
LEVKAVKVLRYRYVPQVEVELTQPEIDNLMEGSRAHYDAICRHQVIAGGLLYSLKNMAGEVSTTTVTRFFEAKELDILAKIAEQPIVEAVLHRKLITAVGDLNAEYRKVNQ